MYNKELKEIFELVKSSEKGLTSREANNRLQENGKNVLTFKKRKSIFKMIFEELTAALDFLYNRYSGSEFGMNWLYGFSRL